MAHVLIHYFSGTGNTARVASLVAEGLTKEGYHVELHNIEVGKRDDAASDLHLFAFPIYAMAAPAIMLRYIRQVAPGNGAKAGIIGVWGELDATGKVPGWEGQALEQAKRMLQHRGYEVYFTDGVGFPESFTAILDTPTADEQVKIAAAGEEKVAAMVERLVAQKQSFRECSIPNQIWSRIVYYLFTLMGRRIMGKFYVTDDQCNGCGQCARICPVGSIHVRGGYPRWNYSCEGCQRCINGCPKEAIQTSAVRALCSVVILFLPYGRWLRTVVDVPQLGPVLSPLFAIGIWLLGMILAGYLLDHILYIAGKIPGVNRFLRISHNRKFLRYLEPHFKPLLHRPRGNSHQEPKSTGFF